MFSHYTEKQWGLKPEEINTSVTARVPVVISCDNIKELLKMKKEKRLFFWMLSRI